MKNLNVINAVDYFYLIFHQTYYFIFLYNDETSVADTQIETSLTASNSLRHFVRWTGHRRDIVRWSPKKQKQKKTLQHSREIEKKKKKTQIKLPADWKETEKKYSRECDKMMMLDNDGTRI